MSSNNCRECTLEITTYRQIEQTDENICEFCQIAETGIQEFPDEQDCE